MNMNITINSSDIKSVNEFLSDKSSFALFSYGDFKVFMVHCDKRSFRISGDNIAPHVFFKNLFKEGVINTGDKVKFISCYSNYVVNRRIGRGLFFSSLFDTNNKVIATLTGDCLTLKEIN